VTLDDENVISNETGRAKDFGFGGKLCIHPAQVEVVKRCFQPTAAEIEWAKLVVNAPSGATSLGGQMIDKPIVERAKSLLDRVQEAEA
jgi:citrate lyase beta subunit